MKILRLRNAKLVAALVAVVNLLLVYFVWKSTMWKNVSNSGSGEPQNPQELAAAHFRLAKEKARNANKHIRTSITIIFRTFYPFEHDLQASIDSILDVLPNMPIFLMQEGIAYPPIVYERNLTADEEQTVRFINLAFDAQKPPDEVHPLNLIKTKFVLFMPDSVRLNNKNLLQKILKEITGKQPPPKRVKSGAGAGAGAAAVGSDAPLKHMIIVPFAGHIKSYTSCTHIHLDLPNWTLQYTAINGTKICDLYLQKHAILVDADILRALPDPFAAPFPELFYIQAKLANISTSIFAHPFQNGRTLFASYHTKQRRLEIRRREFKKMYKELQVKRIVRRSRKPHTKTESKDTSTGPQHNLVLDTLFSSSNFTLPAVTEIDLIGCDRTTKSCIGTVYNNRPFYTYLGRHTPPCCLDKLKTTFHHVLEEFENVGIRYWLDNLALKTAIATNQLSVDAYDIDIAFNVADVERSNALKKSQTKPFTDNEGFYWIKATDGYYFHVQFSKINQVGVNLYPFEINGHEVGPSGFFGKKAKSFSSDFLHPMSTVLFLGKKIMCPNNVAEFLDLKGIT